MPDSANEVEIGFRPEVRGDVEAAAEGYDAREAGLGREFVEEMIRLWEEIAEHPQLGSRRHPNLDVRWRYPERFPYRVVYALDENEETILIVAVLHAARHDGRWRSRII